jgi:hypothetical protein
LASQFDISSPWLRSKLIGVWRGHYICAQGDTGVEVTLTEISEAGDILGTFAFFNLPGMSNVPPLGGKFSITGSYDRKLDNLSFDPVGWIAHPDGYYLVGFAGFPSTDWTHIFGNIKQAQLGCSTIILEKR